jgi:uncharacterized protein
MTGTPYSPSQLGVRPASQLSNQLLAGAFAWMGAGLLLTAAVAWVVSTNESLIIGISRLWLPLAFGQLGFAIVLQGAIRRLSPMVSLGLFFAFAAMLGLTTGVIVSLYTQESVAVAFLSASAMFGGAALYGYTTKRSLVGFGPALFMGMIGLIVASVVNLFLGSSPLGWAIALIGVVIFAIFTAYDVQKIVHGDYAAALGSIEKASILAAVHLYIDFVNLFLFLLRLLGSRR